MEEILMKAQMGCGMPTWPFCTCKVRRVVRAAGHGQATAWCLNWLMTSKCSREVTVISKYDDKWTLSFGQVMACLPQFPCASRATHTNCMAFVGCIALDGTTILAPVVFVAARVMAYKGSAWIRWCYETTQGLRTTSRDMSLIFQPYHLILRSPTYTRFHTF